MSRATVFTSVGGKKELLKKAYDVALVGDDEPIPFPLRPASLAVRAEPDPRRFLAGYTGLLIDMYARLAPIYEAVRGAASADPEVRDVFEAIVTERRIGAGNVVREAYPSDKVIRMTKRPRDTWVISKGALGLTNQRVDVCSVARDCLSKAAGDKVHAIRLYMHETGTDLDHARKVIESNMVMGW